MKAYNETLPRFKVEYALSIVDAVVIPNLKKADVNTAINRLVKRAYGHVTGQPQTYDKQGRLEMYGSQDVRKFFWSIGVSGA